MQPLQQYYIAGSKSGYINYQKPFLTPDDAYQTLENAVVFRDRIVERPGLTFFGRLRRALTAVNAGNVTAVIGTNTYNILSGIGTLETNAELAPGNSSTISIVIGAQTLTDSTGNGILTIAPAGNITAATINYSTWVLTFTSIANFGPTAVTITANYYPGLPVTGIIQRETGDLNNEPTIFFDTKYAYVNNSGQLDGFSEYIPGTTWGGLDSDFFTGANWVGANAYNRILFVANGANTSANPIRYTDGITWTTFQPILDGAGNLLLEAKVLVVYYGRLIALNTFEAPAFPGNNYFARARFSQIGDPTAVDAWRTDIFGKGGFIDAPTDEQIVSAIFYKNTLIVGFERSTWQLRYVGEYGLPFIWERISSDFGCESPQSPILFDQGVLQVGNRAIVSANATNVQRIDEQIPDIVYQFQNTETSKKRVCGIRDFQNELVYWQWIDGNLPVSGSTFTYPNSTLVYNYRNNTWARWRNNGTMFGYYADPLGISWSRTDILWSDFDVFWKSVENKEYETIVVGNQQGYISKIDSALYVSSSIDEPSLSIHAIDLTVVPCRITVPNHNLATGDWIRITNALFNITDPGINGIIYNVQQIDQNTLDLFTWDIQAQAFIPVDFSASAALYQGLGQITFFPLMNIISKDFNPYAEKGMQMKLSYIDFLVDSQPSGQFAVNLYVNTNLGNSANIITGNKNVEEYYRLSGFITDLTIDTTNTNPAVITSPNHGLRTDQIVYISNVVGTTQINGSSYTITYIDSDNFSIAADQSAWSPYLGGGDWLAAQNNLFPYGSNYSWHRFIATSTGQFITYQVTYNNDQMSNLSTQNTNLTLNAVSLWVRSGSRNIF